MLLSVNNLHKNYRNDKGEISRNVLSGLHFQLDERDKVAIVGPSGSGKTTLLNLIGSIDSPDEGNIEFKSKNINEFSQQERASYRSQEIGFIFQLHHLLPQCTVLENVLIPTLVTKIDKTLYEERAETLLNNIGLWDLRHQKPGEISGGECQRVAVIRALINQPALLLADEPTGALDENNANNLMNMLIQLNDQYSTSLVVVTHSMEIAKKMDKIYQLREGQLEQQ